MARGLLHGLSQRPSLGLQVDAAEDYVRSIHGASYTRLFNVDLLTMIREFATDFIPPQKAGDSGGESDGGTGLYCGEQDMFCFLIDPTGWAEINGEAFAPAFFVWNSEVGKRSVGVQTFWFQAVCQNHIVWDAVEVVDFSRKHTANVYDAVADIRGIIARLVETRDAHKRDSSRRDAFVQVMKKAMETRLGSSSDEVLKVLAKQGITRTLAKEAIAHELAHEALHKTDRTGLTRSIAELEAESVAYVVCTHFGLDVEVRASRYIALWDGDGKALRASLDRISKTARSIIDDVEAAQSRKAVA